MADKTGSQTFDFETVAVVLYAMLESGVTLGSKHYQMMSAVDGNRGPDSFNHQFRKAKARAKELQEQANKGGVGEPVKKTKGGSKGATPATGEKKGAKRGKKNKKSDEEEGDDEDESPSKKVKAEAEEDSDGILS
ncbi:hypothetical protein LTR36_008900 [Oleoguttula mirabilis]|uniref:Uncharacterized protein n=1 Tax=Oleoguttula mirabilis TaxID=1507867 RepID=A0AAV9J725_9PEZI|nr:hypothetical protein LTR36_008900 [Oleoguttula mirabilis]